MIHDADLLDQLEALPKESFDGEVFRATRLSLDPLTGSYSGGRWMPPDLATAVYTSLVREGALAEISFHWSQLTPRPTKPIVVHKLRVVTHRTLRLLRTDLQMLGVPDSEYATINLARTQQIGAAVEFLGCDGLIAPSARWPCDNLILFSERMGADAVLELVTSEEMNWIAWAKASGVLVGD